MLLIGGFAIRTCGVIMCARESDIPFIEVVEGGSAIMEGNWYQSLGSNHLEIFFFTIARKKKRPKKSMRCIVYIFLYMTWYDIWYLISDYVILTNIWYLIWLGYPIALFSGQFHVWFGNYAGLFLWGYDPFQRPYRFRHLQFRCLKSWKLGDGNVYPLVI